MPCVISGYDEVITILKRKARPPMEENGSVGDYSPSSSDSCEYRFRRNSEIS